MNIDPVSRAAGGGAFHDALNPLPRSGADDIDALAVRNIDTSTRSPRAAPRRRRRGRTVRTCVGVRSLL
jgi:hypothetical protein